ncbi:hypothetical protein VNO78_15290 [Psophocarpus tetragonolobus]|uniref:Mesoderm development candidate 2 n=1 Tax=Psophocarpus tetragonolobus TaxID=3891 RepID=A0AAN9XJS6_PSOTE
MASTLSNQSFTSFRRLSHFNLQTPIKPNALEFSCYVTQTRKCGSIVPEVEHELFEYHIKTFDKAICVRACKVFDVCSEMRWKAVLSVLVIVVLACANSDYAVGGKRKVHITDELDDVFDDEEDEAWKEWGKKPEPSFPPSDFSKLDPSQIQAEITKRHSGPLIGFVKLRLGPRRTPDIVADFAMKWTHFLRAGAVPVRFMAVDLSTIMFNLETIKDLDELKEFVLDQSEAYEIKIGDQFFRRPGDPPLDQVIEKLHSEKAKAANAIPEEIDPNIKTEL